MRCDYEDITSCHICCPTTCVVFFAAAQLPRLFSLALNLCDRYITFRPPPRKRRPARRGRLVPERSSSNDERTRTSNSLFPRGTILRVGMTRNAIIYFAFNLKKKLQPEIRTYLCRPIRNHLFTCKQWELIATRLCMLWYIQGPKHCWYQKRMMWGAFDALYLSS